MVTPELPGRPAFVYIGSVHSAEYGSTGYGCQSFSWSAEQENIIFPCLRSWRRFCSCETGSAVPSRVSPLSFSTLRLNRMPTHGIPPAFRDHAHLPFIYTTRLLGSVPSLYDHAIAYRWRIPPRVRRLKAISPQGSSSNGVLPIQKTPWTKFMRLFFPTPCFQGGTRRGPDIFTLPGN